VLGVSRNDPSESIIFVYFKHSAQQANNIFRKTLSREQRIQIQRNSRRVKTRQKYQREMRGSGLKGMHSRALSLLHFILLSDAASNSSAPGNNRGTASSCTSSEVTVDIVEAATATPVTQCNSNMSRNWREASLMAGAKALGKP
jgi:hypothetical protein